MSSIEEYSPLFRVRKILHVQRFLLGFPLKENSGVFCKFSFLTWSEYTKCLIILLIMSVGHLIHIFVVFNGNRGAVFNLSHNPLYIFGFSSTDVVLLELFSFLILLSCLFYVNSYKQQCNRISTICQKIIHSRKNINFIAMKSQRLTVDTFPNIHVATKKTLLYTYCLAIVAMFTMVYAWSEEYPKYIEMINKHIPKYHRNFFIASQIGFGYCYCYPMVALSTDIVISHLLQEVGNDFTKWTHLIKIRTNTNVSTLGEYNATMYDSDENCPASGTT